MKNIFAFSKRNLTIYLCMVAVILSSITLINSFLLNENFKDLTLSIKLVTVLPVFMIIKFLLLDAFKRKSTPVNARVETIRFSLIFTVVCLSATQLISL